MYQNSYMLDRLMRQKEELDGLIKSYQNPQQPVNNFINTSQPQTTPKDLVEWRILNENEEVDNLYVQNKTLFIGDNMMVLKGVDGGIEKWEIKKVYPVDKKDQKINELEEEIKKLKEIIKDEHTEPISTITERKQSNADDDVNAKPNTKAVDKYISKQK